MVIPSMDFKDYYKILGVEPTADDKAIKAAYRKLARKYHPDVSKEKDAEAKFKDASEAYEALKSADKRAEYDDCAVMASMVNRSRARRAGRAVVAVAAAGHRRLFGLLQFDLRQSRPRFRWRRGGTTQRRRRGQDVEMELAIFWKTLSNEVEEGQLPGAAVQRRRPARQQHHKA
jgi:curved DNA-binding protein